MRPPPPSPGPAAPMPLRNAGSSNRDVVSGKITRVGHFCSCECACAILHDVEVFVLAVGVVVVAVVFELEEPWGIGCPPSGVSVTLD
mmetsp:Transcript_39273/g.97051  ORF Transcript_39273/g.97051 Transcript_39273/m.97051 type:complete len:87 (-) Transcript_39273:751-1011(-)